jgi:HEPN domain-containing protein
MRDIKQAGLLISLAKTDLKALEGMTSSDIFAEEIFGFHAQQAIEKTLKAWLALIGCEYPLTHNISVLLETLRTSGVDINDYLSFSEYSIFAVKLRYETVEIDEEPLDRLRVIQQVQGIVKKVEEMLEEPE